MSRPVPTKAEAIGQLQAMLVDDDDPRLTINQVSVLVQFHRRTLQRYVDEGLIPVERIGPKSRVFIRWGEVCRMFPQDTRRILASLAKPDRPATLTTTPLSSP